MIKIGKVERRKIYYVQVRNNPDWKNSLPKRDWVAFTIANPEDEELIPPMTKVCLDNNVSYTCSAGNFANITEDYFDEEISWRGVAEEMHTNTELNYDKTPVTTAHKNFEEGFWFAATLANDDQYEIDKVVCIDLTKRKVKQNIVQLILKIREGWLPSENETISPKYDE